MISTMVRVAVPGPASEEIAATVESSARAPSVLTVSSVLSGITAVRFKRSRKPSRSVAKSQGSASQTEMVDAEMKMWDKYFGKILEQRKKHLAKCLEEVISAAAAMANATKACR